MRAGDAGLGQFAERSFGSFGGSIQGGQGDGVGAGIGAVLLDECGGNMVNDAVVPVLASQANIAFDAQALETAPPETHQGDVESPPA